MNNNNNTTMRMFVAMARQCNWAAVQDQQRDIRHFARGKRDAFMSAARLVDVEGRVTPLRHR